MTKRRKKKEGPKAVTASWSTMALTMLETFHTSTDEGKETIRREIGKMARAADAYNDLVS